MTSDRYNPDRSYTIDITGHGLKALQYCEATKAFDDNLIPFKGINLRFVGKTDKWEQPGWTGSRGDICRALQTEIDKYPGRVKIEFDTTVTIKNIFAGEITTQKGDGEVVPSTWDLIVGCDGAGAVTRNALRDQLPGFTVESDQVGNYCSMIQFDPALEKVKALDPTHLEIFQLEPFVVAGAINGEGGKDDPKWFCMVGYKEETQFDTVDAAKAYLEESAGKEFFDYISDAELAEFIKRPCNNIGRSKLCSSYHGGKVVLVGDSGNPFPPIGQGINHAMEAAVELDKLVKQALADGRPLEWAAAQYTLDWKPEGDAVNWIAKRVDFSSSYKMFLVKLALAFDASVLSNAKKHPDEMTYKQAADLAKSRHPNPSEHEACMQCGLM